MKEIVKEFIGFAIVTAMFAATSLNREFYGIARGNLQELEVTVNISNQMLVIDGSFCYLPVNTQTFEYWQLTQLLSDRGIGFLMKIATLVNRNIRKEP